MHRAEDRYSGMYAVLKMPRRADKPKHHMPPLQAVMLCTPGNIDSMLPLGEREALNWPIYPEPVRQTLIWLWTGICFLLEGWMKASVSTETVHLEKSKGNCSFWKSDWWIKKYTYFNTWDAKRPDLILNFSIGNRGDTAKHLNLIWKPWKYMISVAFKLSSVSGLNLSPIVLWILNFKKSFIC